MVTVDEKSIVDLYNAIEKVFYISSLGIRGSLYWANEKNSAFPREVAKGFQKFLEKTIGDNNAESAGIKSRLKPLSEKWLKIKSERGYSSERWHASGKLSESIITTGSGNDYTVEVDPSAISMTGDAPESLTTVVEWLERGKVDYNFPARPLWQLTLDMFNAGKIPKFEKAVSDSIAKYVKDSTSLFKKSKSTLSDVINADIRKDFSIDSLENAINGNFGSDSREREMVNYAVKKVFS